MLWPSECNRTVNCCLTQVDLELATSLMVNKQCFQSSGHRPTWCLPIALRPLLNELQMTCFQLQSINADTRSRRQALAAHDILQDSEEIVSHTVCGSSDACICFICLESWRLGDLQNLKRSHAGTLAMVNRYFPLRFTNVSSSCKHTPSMQHLYKVLCALHVGSLRHLTSWHSCTSWRTYVRTAPCSWLVSDLIFDKIHWPLGDIWLVGLWESIQLGCWLALSFSLLLAVHARSQDIRPTHSSCLTSFALLNQWLHDVGSVTFHMHLFLYTASPHGIAHGLLWLPASAP